MATEYMKEMTAFNVVGDSFIKEDAEGRCVTANGKAWWIEPLQVIVLKVRLLYAKGNRPQPDMSRNEVRTIGNINNLPEAALKARTVREWIHSLCKDALSDWQQEEDYQKEKEK